MLLFLVFCLSLHSYCIFIVLEQCGGHKGTRQGRGGASQHASRETRQKKFCSSALPYCLYCFRSRKLKVRKQTKSFSFSCWQHKNTQRKITHGEMPHTHIRRAGRIGTPWPKVIICKSAGEVSLFMNHCFWTVLFK